MKNEKIGIGLIILGNILYVFYIFFCRRDVSSFGDFTSGVLLGLSIWINLLGIVLTISGISKNKNDK